MIVIDPRILSLVRTYLKQLAYIYEQLKQPLQVITSKQHEMLEQQWCCLIIHPSDAIAVVIHYCLCILATMLQPFQPYAIASENALALLSSRVHQGQLDHLSHHVAQ